MDCNSSHRYSSVSGPPLRLCEPSPTSPTQSRSLKQVKNWFSNERQKNKEGRVERLDTLEGDKVKFRPLAVDIQERWPGCPAQWSDEFFEEVVMIYDYMVLTHLRANESSA